MKRKGRTNTVRMGMFLTFLMIAAAQDLHRKQVKIWVFVLFGILALVMDGYLYIDSAEGFMWKQQVQSVSVGAGLLLLGKLCNNHIGMGDGYFFMISGLMLTVWENLAILSMSVMLCGLFGLILFVYRWIHDRKNIGKMTLPLLPFAVLPGIFLAVENGLGR